MKRSFNAIFSSLLLFLLVFNLVSFSQDKSQIKLFRFGPSGNEKPGILTTNGQRLDVSSFGEDYNPAFFSSGGIMRLKQWLTTNQSKCPSVPSTERIASCISSPSKIVAIGLNYLDHIKEGSAPVPGEPVIFLKATSALCGPYDNVLIPLGATKVDWECELAIVIGRKASYVPEADALEYVAGYTIMNDYSERAWQLERTAGQWDKGKSSDHFAPLGPYLISPQEVGDPHKLKLWLTVNGDTMQNSNTGFMIFKIKRLISEVSRYMTLLPGDVISTGTPSGVGLGHKPPIYLKTGDVVELGIEKIGKQKQTAVDAMKEILGDDAYKDYQAWLALGLGGIPNTLEGYRRVKMLGAHLGNPFDVSVLKGDIGSKGDIKALVGLPKRKGPRPTIAPFAVPHRQTNQLNDTVTRRQEKKIFEAQVVDPKYKLVYKMSYFEKHSPAIFLKDSVSGNLALVPLTHGEIAHIHPTDGSMHMILSPSDTRTVIESGWGELHGLAGQGGEMAKTYMMIYSPRDEKELAVTRKILEAAVKYAVYVPK